MVYNLAMLILNFFICFKLSIAALKLNYTIMCEPTDPSSPDTEVRNDKLYQEPFQKFNLFLFPAVPLDHKLHVGGLHQQVHRANGHGFHSRKKMQIKLFNSRIPSSYNNRAVLGHPEVGAEWNT